MFEIHFRNRSANNVQCKGNLNDGKRSSQEENRRSNEIRREKTRRNIERFVLIQKSATPSNKSAKAKKKKDEEERKKKEEGKTTSFESIFQIEKSTKNVSRSAKKNTEKRSIDEETFGFYVDCERKKRQIVDSVSKTRKTRRFVGKIESR